MSFNVSLRAHIVLWIPANGKGTVRWGSSCSLVLSKQPMMLFPSVGLQSVLYRSSGTRQTSLSLFKVICEQGMCITIILWGPAYWGYYV